MYLITAYFDKKSSKILSGYIDRIAEKTGNDFMKKNHVPPHLTISALEAKGEKILLPHFETLEGRKDCLAKLCRCRGDEKIETGIFFASVGMFLPYVIHIAPVLNQYLSGLSEWVYRTFSDIPEVRVSRFYRPFQWFPHVTLGKTLSKEEMRIAFEVMQHNFAPFEGKIVSLGLAKVNPHEDLQDFSLVEF